MKIQEIKNTLGPHQRETLVLRKGDVGGTVHFTVPDLTGITSADFRLIKPDGTFVVKSGAIVQNTVIVQITEQMCTAYGSGIYNLELKASGVSVYTAIGRCLIDKNIDLNDYAASVAEVNGLVFPDDFLTNTDLSNYATKTYVDTAIASIPVYTPTNYSTTEQNTGIKWVDGKYIYQKSIFVDGAVSVSTSAITVSSSYFDVSIVDTFISASAIRLTGSRGTCSTPASAWKDGTSFKIYGSTTVTNVDYITVQYTKTTDTV